MTGLFISLILADDQRSIAVARNGVIIDIYRALVKELLFPWQLILAIPKVNAKEFYGLYFLFNTLIVDVGRDNFFHKHNEHK